MVVGMCVGHEADLLILPDLAAPFYLALWHYTGVGWLERTSGSPLLTGKSIVSTFMSFTTWGKKKSPQDGEARIPLRGWGIYMSNFQSC